MKTVRSLTLFGCGWLIAFLGTAAAKDDAGWTALFDGETFAGWEFDVLENAAPESIWSIEDGVIVCRGADKPAGVMRTKKSYGDYELQLEWRWPAKAGNSGVLIHCSAPRFMSVWPQSLEVQLHNGDAGDLIYIGETIEVPPEQIAEAEPGSWKVRLRHNLTDDSEKPAGEWNHMRILAVGDTVTVYVNGELVNKGTHASVSSGAICLQAEKADVEFRNVRMRQIEPGN